LGVSTGAALGAVFLASFAGFCVVDTSREGRVSNDRDSGRSDPHDEGNAPQGVVATEWPLSGGGLPQPCEISNPSPITTCCSYIEVLTLYQGRQHGWRGLDSTSWEYTLAFHQKPARQQQVCCRVLRAGIVSITER